MAPTNTLPGLDRTARGIPLMLLAVHVFTARDAMAKLMFAGYPAAQLIASASPRH